jgi:hypothetical protein
MLLYTQIKGKPDRKKTKPLIPIIRENITIIRRGNQIRRKRP